MPHFVGQARNTFGTPHTRSRMSPKVSQRLLESLNLVLIADDEEPSVSTGTPRSDVSHMSAATTITCCTEGSRCVTL